jgi:hypothetical protein
MLEPTLFAQLQKNFQHFEQYQLKQYMSEPSKKMMKAKLIDV